MRAVSIPPRPPRLAQFIEQHEVQLRERAAPLLEQGERIQVIFPAQVGLNPSGGTFVGAFSVLNQKIVVAATDRAIVILRARRKFQPVAVLARLPRSTKLGPARAGMRRAFRRLALDDPTYISSVYRLEVEQADELAPPADD